MLLTEVLLHTEECDIQVRMTGDWTMSEQHVLDPQGSELDTMVIPRTAERYFWPDAVDWYTRSTHGANAMYHLPLAN